MNIPPAYHGALDYAELERLGLAPEDVLDFSVNSHPFGPSPAVMRAVAATPLERYPDRQCLALRRALAKFHQLNIEQICVGSGTAELINHLARVYLKPGDVVLIIGPTFGEYERACRLAGAEVHFWQADAHDNFEIHFSEIEDCFNKIHPRLVFICNPNNPTGRFIPLNFLRSCIKSHPDICFAVDEAYLSFIPGQNTVFSQELHNVLVLRSMTKDYALAGLRLGYVLAHASLCLALTESLPPWNVNALAQAAGLAALHDPLYAQQWDLLPGFKNSLTAQLADMDLFVFPSTLHFFLVRVGCGVVFRRELLKQGIMVRDCASFGLPDCIRISTRLPVDNQRLLAAIQKVLINRDS
ncbi:MAG: histidinol-phosphate aminotransferase family protein [Anaerolineae bacterium]|nr:histidinol-phosphate aminotransferase family protein [Anaerolineae bacterium]